MAEEIHKKMANEKKTSEMSTTPRHKPMREYKFWKKEECPSYGTTCSKGNKKNHFARKVRSNQETYSRRISVGGLLEDAGRENDPGVQYVPKLSTGCSDKAIISMEPRWHRQLRL